MPLKLKRKRDEKTEENTENQESKKQKPESLFTKIKRTFTRKGKSESKEDKTQRTVKFDVEEEKDDEKATKKLGFMTPVNARNFTQFFTPGTPGLTPGGYTLTPVQGTSYERRNWFILNEEFKLREGRDTEFKTGGGMYPIQVLPEHIRKYGSGFLNSIGGTLYAGILDDGIVKGISCNDKRRNAICQVVRKEFDQFIPKVGREKYSVRFIPVAYPLTSYQKRYGGRDYIPDVNVVEIKVECGEVGELYEDGLHQVFMRRDGGVEGPLAPLEIKEVVITKYLEVLQNRKNEKNSKPRRVRPDISPIKFDL